MKINDDNPAGIIWIGFKPNVDESVVEERISQIYKDNEDIIQGMVFDKVTDVKSMVEEKKKAEKNLMEAKG